MATVAEAQPVTAAIPVESRAYADLERLRGLGLIDHHIQGQRPMSRRYLAAQVGDAWSNLGRLDARPQRRAAAERLLAEIAFEHGWELPRERGLAPALASVRIDGIAAALTFLDSDPRPIIGAGMTAIDAIVDPLAESRGGRRLGRRTAEFEAAASGEPGSHVALSVQARSAWSSQGDGGGASLRTRLIALNGTVGAFNTRLTVGRTPIQLGQGIDGGLLVSRNSPPLDMVQLRSDMPARLPGFLRRVGPVHGVLFVADLGQQRRHPHSKLAGWKLSAMPSPSLEVGVSVAAQSGGEGAPPARFSERVIDLVPLVDVLLYQDRDLQFSNKLAGVDIRWRHSGSGAELYMDMMADDFDIRRVRSSLWEDAGYAAGVVLPAVGPAGNWRAEAELQHTGLRFYEHVQFRSGITRDHAIIGLPLGPRGAAVKTRLHWTGDRRREMALTLAAERRSGDQYETSVSGVDDSGWQFIKIADHPEELRRRALVSWTMPAGRFLGRLAAEAGVEWTRNYGYQAGDDRMSALGRVSLMSGF